MNTTTAADRPGRSALPSRALAASGGVLASVSVALFAYAAHAAEPQVQSSLHSAALFAFGEMLLYDAGWVAVLDRDDRFLGVLTPDSLYEASRRSLGD